MTYLFYFIFWFCLSMPFAECWGLYIWMRQQGRKFKDKDMPLQVFIKEIKLSVLQLANKACCQNLLQSATGNVDRNSSKLMTYLLLSKNIINHDRAWIPLYITEINKASKPEHEVLIMLFCDIWKGAFRATFFLFCSHCVNTFTSTLSAPSVIRWT